MSIEKEIESLLLKLQAGYQNRDIEQVDSFVEDLFFKDAEVIGTASYKFSDAEWCVGLDEIKTLIRDDWKHWGDLTLNLNDAHISCENNVIFVALTGMVYEVIKHENYYKYRLGLINNTLNEDRDDKEKLLEIIRGATDTLLETGKGNQYNWPLRLSMTLLKWNDKWKIKQCHFSYPITFYPQVRM